MIFELPKELLKRAYVSFACRRVEMDDASHLIKEPYTPTSGDVVIAKIKNIGQHKRIELASGRKAALIKDDIVVLAYGNRYAPDQFEGLVPHSLSPCAMVAAGGIAATEVARNHQIEKATQIQPIGVLADSQGKAINLHRYRSKVEPQSVTTPPVIVVCGTSMNAGKTHTAACLIRGLTQSGYKVGAAKITGTGSGGDMWRMQDAGAETTIDFTDAGHASTYKHSIETLIETMEHLVSQLNHARSDVIVAEIADGLSHSETRDLLLAPETRKITKAVFFAAGDAMGAAWGEKCLRKWNLPLMGIAGKLTLSPLATRELCALAKTPIATAEQLSSPGELKYLLGNVLHNKQRSDANIDNADQEKSSHSPSILLSHHVTNSMPAVKRHASVQKLTNIVQ